MATAYGIKLRWYLCVVNDTKVEETLWQNTTSHILNTAKEDETIHQISHILLQIKKEI